MTVGLLVMDMIIEEATSLKDKRMVLSGLKDRVGRQFNVSLIESAHQDLWRNAELSFAVLAISHRQAEQQLDSIERFIFDSYPGRHSGSHRQYFDGLEK